MNGGRLTAPAVFFLARRGHSAINKGGEIMDPKFMEQFHRTHELIESCAGPRENLQQDGWTVKEIVGHLNDSAGNNVQRLQRYVPGGELKFPAYEQETFVSRARYREFDFNLLIQLWRLQNTLLFHIYDRIPPEHLDSIITVGDRPGMTISQLMADYFRHMEVHERQIREILD